MNVKRTSYRHFWTYKERLQTLSRTCRGCFKDTLLCSLMDNEKGVNWFKFDFRIFFLFFLLSNLRNFVSNEILNLCWFKEIKKIPRNHKCLLILKQIFTITFLIRIIILILILTWLGTILSLFYDWNFCVIFS